ncbi:hydrolase TatD, partial [candidate division KSB1 bacterium]
RGKRNEPSYTIHIVSGLAQLFNMSVEEIAEITTLNAEKLFLTGS